MPTKNGSVLRSGSLQVHHRMSVGFGDKNLRGEKMMDEFLMGSFWRKIFDGVQDPLFECYDTYTMLNLVVFTPQDLGLRSGNNKVPLSHFFSHVALKFPELDFVKPEAAFQLQRSYDLKIGEAHYFAIPQPGITMRAYNFSTKKTESRLVYHGLRLLGVPHLRKEGAVYRLLQPVPHYDTHWTRRNVKWVFALKSQVDMDTMSSDAEIHTPLYQGNQEQIDREFDEAMLFLNRSNR